MVKTTIDGHEIEFFDSIEELPMVRFHKYQKALLVDAGVGSDMESFDRRLLKAREFINAGKTDKAAQELENLRQCVFLVQEGLSTRHRAFAPLVVRLDGRDCTDVSDAGLEGVVEALKDIRVTTLASLLGSAKKKIDGELTLYFPSLFGDAEVKEYFDLLKRRTLEVLLGIADGVADPLGTDAARKLTTELITYSNPRVFTGTDGAEVQHDRQFGNLGLVLSEQLHVDPRAFTVMEFYNAFDFVKERSKQAERARKNHAGKR